MTQRIKTLKDGYYQPTPAKWRKIGDTIQDIAVIGSAIVAVVAAPPAWIPVLIFAVGRLGKIITNFATK
jgi:hypothetical protein